jgi:hypothetical protein
MEPETEGLEEEGEERKRMELLDARGNLLKAEGTKEVRRLLDIDLNNDIVTRS